MHSVRRQIPLWLAIILVLAGIFATATALTIRAMQIEKISIWGGQIQDTNFALVNIDTKVKGPHRIDIDLELANTDSAPHSARVTLQLLDSGGNVIAEATQLTGTVAGGAHWTTTFTFTATNIVSSYDRPFLVVKQLS